MFLPSILLLLSGIASLAGFYFYQKEKRGLREFIRQSRRHNYHKSIDIALQKKASRYLAFSITFFFISLLILYIVFLK